MTDIEQYMLELGAQARTASWEIGKASTAAKNSALTAIADAVDASREDLLAANRLDLQAGTDKGLADALMDRLELTPARIGAMIDGLHQVAALPDPVGEFQI